MFHMWGMHKFEMLVREPHTYVVPYTLTMHPNTQVELVRSPVRGQERT